MRAAAKTNNAAGARPFTLLALSTLLLAALAALFTATAPAWATTDSTDSTKSTKSTESTDPQATYLAAQLRKNPVYITDQLPREIPKSTTPAFEKLAERTATPTYVLVLPTETAGIGLLADVHDLLDKDGLYVLLDESTVTEARAYGTDAPAEAAATAAYYELPYDAGPLHSFERFTEIVTLSPSQAEARAEAARDKYDTTEPVDLYLTQSDRDDQSTLTGLALTGVPLLILLLVPYVRRWRRRLPGASRREPRPRPRWILPTVALATAVVIAVAAPLVFDETRSSAAPKPRAVDLNARLDRVAAGLAEDPVYEDPESPRVLDDRQLAQLHTRIEKFGRSEGGGPVFVALVPQLYEDESAGDEEVFAAAVHDKLHQNGVYVVADPLAGYIEVYNHGLRLDSWDLDSYYLPESITGDAKAADADDHLMGERLDALMTVLDKAERTDEPETTGDPVTASDPIAENDLRPLYYGEFWNALFTGVFVALLLFGLVAAALGITRKVLLRRRPAPQPTSSLPTTSPTAPTLPYLRETARAELRAMKTEFADATPDARARNRHEATLLLTDGTGDIDDDVSPATLVAVIVLARATRAALAHHGATLCCGVNPLHGPATATRHIRVSTENSRRKMLPLCDHCLNTHPNELPDRLLKLPGSEAPYYEDDLLSAVPDGFSKLGRKVRESTQVR